MKTDLGYLMAYLKSQTYHADESIPPKTPEPVIAISRQRETLGERCAALNHANHAKH